MIINVFSKQDSFINDKTNLNVKVKISKYFAIIITHNQLILK